MIKPSRKEFNVKACKTSKIQLLYLHFIYGTALTTKFSLTQFGHIVPLYICIEISAVIWLMFYRVVLTSTLSLMYS